MDRLSLSDDLLSIVARHPVVLIEVVRPALCCVYWHDGEADPHNQHGFAEAQSLRQARAIARKFGPPGHTLIIVERAA